jgi:hypothetical protein
MQYSPGQSDLIKVRVKWRKSNKAFLKSFLPAFKSDLNVELTNRQRYFEHHLENIWMIDYLKNKPLYSLLVRLGV